MYDEIVNEIIKSVEIFINIRIYFLFAIIIIALFASISLQNDVQYNENTKFKLADNIFRVLAGASAGGLLTILMINRTSRMRAFYSYRAIIGRLVELSSAAYVDILGNYGRGEFMNKLHGSGYGPKDGSAYIYVVISLLKEKARELEKVESTSGDTKYVLGYFIYGRSCNYVKDLTNIYYRDAINNTTDKYILEKLYHCTERGLVLIGLLEGDQFKQSSRLWVLAFFLETNLELYKVLLKQLGKTVAEPEIKVTGAKA